jgi:dipeptidyl aminopeptidase/acylaminoacyl peptidase
MKFFVLALFATGLTAQKLPFDMDAMLKLRRVGDPQISPVGKLVAFSAVGVDTMANKKRPHLYMVEISGGAVHE